MSLPNGFSGRQFWGIQLKVGNTREDIRVNPDTELHISKAIVKFYEFIESHEADCYVNIGVEYVDDTVLRYKPAAYAYPRKCVVCVLNPEKKLEADLDLNFVGGVVGKDICFYKEHFCNCVRNSNPYVNLSGYVVSK